MAALTIWVKGDPEKKELGDCPFCHRALLTLETKGAEYEKDFIDFAKKPDWLQEKAGGKVPVINDDGQWVADSGEIVKYLDKKMPTPVMAPGDDSANLGANFFGAFVGFLKAPSDDPELKTKQQTLRDELEKIDVFLGGIRSPFIGGETLNDTDASLAPKLHHMDIALKHFKKTDLLKDFPAVRSYLDRARGCSPW